MRYLILITLFLFSFLASADLTNTDKQYIFAKPALPNGGFENSKQKWTASGGTFTIVTSGTNKLTGYASATWDSGSADQTLKSDNHSFENRFASSGGVAWCRYQVPSGNATHLIQVLDGSGNLLASNPIISSTIPTYTFVGFPFPAQGGAIAVQTKSLNSDEPLIAIDDCSYALVEEVKVGQSSQAALIGTAYIAGTASCTWARTNTAIGAFTSTAACPGPTIETNPGPGVIQTTDTDLARFTVNNLPPGIYEVTIDGAWMDAGSAGVQQGLAINDGTTTSRVQSPGVSGSSQGNAVNVSGIFTYTNGGNKTFELYGGSASAQLVINNTATYQNLRFRIKRWPLASEQTQTFSTIAQTWSGYHDATCSFARTNTAYGDPTADATCAIVESKNINFGTVTSALSGSDKLAGVVFTPTAIKTFRVCAAAHIVMGTSGNQVAAQIVDGAGTYIGSTSFLLSGNNSSITETICGQYTIPTIGVATTIKLQTKSTGGAATVNSGDNVHAIKWTFEDITQAVAPMVVADSTYVSSTSNNATPGGTNQWIQFTTNSVSLTPGKWVCNGTVVASAVGSVAYGQSRLSWAGANGANSASTPVAFSTLSGVTLNAGFESNHIVPAFNGDNAMFNAPTVRFTVTQTQSLFLNFLFVGTTASNARVQNYLYCERISL